MADAVSWLGRYLEAIHAERDAAKNTLISYHRDLWICKNTNWNVTIIHPCIFAHNI